MMARSVCSILDHKDVHSYERFRILLLLSLAKACNIPLHSLYLFVLLVLVNKIHQCTPYHCSLGVAGNFGNMCRRGESKPHSQRQATFFRIATNSSNKAV